MLSLPESIPYRDSLSPEEFCHSFLIPNLPVLLGPSLTSPWPAHHHWVVHQPPHSPQGSQPANPLDLPVWQAKLSYWKTQWNRRNEALLNLLEGLVATFGATPLALCPTSRTFTAEPSFLETGCKARQEMTLPSATPGPPDSHALPWRIPDRGYLLAQFGEAQVSVADCCPLPEDGENGCMSVQATTFREFIQNHLSPLSNHPISGSVPAKVGNILVERLHTLGQIPPEEVTGDHIGALFDNLVHCRSNPSTTNDVLSKTDVSVGQFYLKDWHLVKDYPNVAAYATPALFTDDWINEFWDHRTDSDDDYRFVYIGGHRTWTPFHTDVFRSYSWSTNICGIKLWTMYPPGQESTFTDSFGNTVFDINNYNHAQFPHFENATRFQVYQLPGQTLFVPSGWAHQVENIGETISINHNWANACNLPDLYGTLVRELDLVEHAIRDCAGMEGWSAHCQLLLRANHGIHFADFYRLLAFKARSLVAQLWAAGWFPPSCRQANGTDGKYLSTLTQSPPLQLKEIPSWTWIHRGHPHYRSGLLDSPDYFGQPGYWEWSLSRIYAVLGDLVHTDRLKDEDWRSAAAGLFNDLGYLLANPLNGALAQ
ncbi:hypothetical protein H4R33_006635 [Dimargaris cristalligena]|nr:hypothetical protein H4R33_006635 [Dimargaris cristalligena]